ncbi:thiamine pyrophosphate-dependent enzyme [Methanospirillum sp.]|uniref:thiamine pyrophosphate-dependent enzyme n=1 Tax=Methanospirillum sp. TaxID=45200 RepID=UPI002C555816|nr:thiamine pyrophosphate-dependent enzyme [Methanospirillum sp.]HPP78954.1 thiamine pyrophosphate-binding protein [Methanospirillum sp.]
MAVWKCSICGYLYNETTGDPTSSIPPGTLFPELPDTWRCPVCHADKTVFEQVRKAKPQDRSFPTVSEVIIDNLVHFGITEYFGVPGTSSLGIIDAIRKNEKAHFILFRHEENAAMAASAYNKLTGKIAACVTIAGPGATNLATGLYDAKEDRASVLSINGQVEMQYAGPGGFQEIDQDAFFRPVTVYNNTIYDKKIATKILTMAVQHAVVRRGVAQISFPNDIQKQEIDPEFTTVRGVIPSLIIRPDVQTIQKAIDLITSSINPVILAGWGAYHYSDLVASFAEKIDAPVLSTFRAKGIFADDHPMYAGVLGTVGSSGARTMVEEADLLITLGVGFSKMTRVPEHLRILQIDYDPLRLGKGKDTLPVYGDVGEVLTELLSRLHPSPHAHAIERVTAVKKPWIELRRKEAEDLSIPIRPPVIMDVLSRVIPPDAIISIDVGENGWWFGRNFRMNGQKFVMSGYLATMGFGFPGAIAGKIAYPDRPVFCITGDGGFAMAMGDFVTTIKYNLPMVVIVLNNHELGMIRVEQQLEEYPNFATSLHNPDFVMYARSCGGDGIRVEKPEDLESAVLWAMGKECPVIVDVITDPGRFH